ncbi:MAG: PucR family transcriptional regulator [Eubacteriaceae bacterium]
MKLKNILNHLTWCKHDLIENNILDNDVKNIAHIKDYNKYQLDNTIFYGYFHEIDNTFHGKIIITEDIEDYMYGCESNFILMDTDYIEKSVNIIKDILAGESKLDTFKKEMFEYLLEGKDIHAFVKKTFEAVENPVIITDSTYRLISLYPEEKINESIYDSILEKGYVNQEIMNQIEFDHTKEETLKRDFPFHLDWGFAKDIRRIARRISNGNCFLGVIGVIESFREFRQIDLEIIEVLCKVINLLMINKNTPNDERNVYKQTLLANLIEGDIYDSKKLKKAFKLSSIAWQEPYRIITVPYDINNFSLVTIKNFQEDVLRESKRIESTIHYSYIVFLIYGENIEEDIFKIEKILARYDLICGISDKFYNLINAAIHYKQALTAYKYGKKEKLRNRKHFFSLYYEHFIFDIIKEKEKPQIFIFPGVYELYNYDKKFNTEYFITILTYLQNYKNATLVSNLLHIHRNTLNYRLKKSEEIMNIDLSDNKFSRYLQLSLQLFYETYEVKD